MNKFKSTFFCGIILLCLGGIFQSWAEAVQVVLPASADAAITEAFPAQDTTAWSVVIVQTNNGGNAGFGIQSMVKFDLSGLGLNAANVRGVKLRLYATQFDVTGGGANDFTTQVRANTLDFDEGAGFPTWNTHNLAYSSKIYGQLTTLGATNGPPALGWYEIDLDPALVKGWIDGSISNYGVHLYGNNNFWRTQNPRFSSRQGANAPELVLDISTDYIYTSSADATITEPFPDQDASGWTTIRVLTNNGGNAGFGEQGMVKFDLSGFDRNAANVLGAKLRLYVDQFAATGGGANPFTLEVRENTLDWNEDANSFPTWTTHNLAYGSTVEGSLTFDANNVGVWIEVDIAPALVKGWINGSINNYGIQLYGNNTFWRTKNPYFSSREGSNAPQLVISVGNDFVYTPTADATLTEPFPDQDATAWTTIRVLTNNLGNTGFGHQGLVKFDLSGGLNAASVASAKLRLYVTQFEVTGGGSHPFKLDALNSTLDWNEDANSFPTWNTHNTAHDSLLSSIVLDGTEVDTWVEMDLDLASVRGWVDGSIPNYGMQLYGHDSYWRTNNPYFSSKEGANAPQLILTAVGTEAWSPSPGDGDPNINTSLTLSWSSGKNAVSHDVYFGEDPNAVAAAQRQLADIDGSGSVDFGDVKILGEQWLGGGIADLNGDNTTDVFDFAIVADSWQQPGDPTFMGNQTANSFVTGTLGIAKTYYWRVDEVHADNSITTGMVWAVHVAYDLAMPASSTNPQAVAEVLAGKRTVADAAWWGFNGTDDTGSIQNAINSGTQKVIVPNMGSNWNVRPITLVSNQDIYFEPNVVVIAKQGGFHGNGDTLFSALSKWNIKIYGDNSSLVTLQMRKADYLTGSYTASSTRMLLTLVNCNNVQVSGLTLKDSGGDGVYLGGSDRDIILQDLIIDNSMRNNLSVIGVKNLLVENCVFKNSSDGSINAGIEIEPDSSLNRIVNCVIRNCNFANNDSGAIMMLFQNTTAATENVSISVENCDIIGGSGTGFIIANSAVGGSVSVSGCNITNLGGEGLAVWDVPNLAAISFTNCAWTNVTQVGVVNTALPSCVSPDCITVPGAITFSNCFINGRDAVNPSLLPVDLESSSGVTVVP